MIPVSILTANDQHAGAAPVTRFRGLSRRGALIVVGRVGVLAREGLRLVPLLYQQPTTDPGQGSDREMYARVIADMQQGASYYDAVRKELSEGRYGMQSVFNWRTPLFLSAIAAMPSMLWP